MLTRAVASLAGSRRMGFQRDFGDCARRERSRRLFQPDGTGPCCQCFPFFGLISTLNIVAQYFWELLNYLEGEPSKTARWNVATAGAPNTRSDAAMALTSER